MRRLAYLLLIVSFLLQCDSTDDEVVVPSIYNGEASVSINGIFSEFELLAESYDQEVTDSIYLLLRKLDRYGRKLAGIGFRNVGMSQEKQVLLPFPNDDNSASTASYSTSDEDVILSSYTVLQTDTISDYIQLTQFQFGQDTVVGEFRFSAVVRPNSDIDQSVGRSFEAVGEFWFVLD